jgi:hypothetical protein
MLEVIIELLPEIKLHLVDIKGFIDSHESFSSDDIPSISMIYMYSCVIRLGDGVLSRYFRRCVRREFNPIHSIDS